MGKKLLDGHLPELFIEAGIGNLRCEPPQQPVQGEFRGLEVVRVQSRYGETVSEKEPQSLARRVVVVIGGSMDRLPGKANRYSNVPPASGCDGSRQQRPMVGLRARERSRRKPRQLSDRSAGSGNPAPQPGRRKPRDRLRYRQFS